VLISLYYSDIRIFSADCRRTKTRRRIRLSAAVWGSSVMRYDTSLWACDQQWQSATHLATRSSDIVGTAGVTIRSTIVADRLTITVTLHTTYVDFVSLKQKINKSSKKIKLISTKDL